MMRNLALSLITFFILANCQPPAPPTPSASWQLVYKNTPNGDAIIGDKTRLMDAIRHGYPIRVGWASRRVNDSIRSVEHLVDAEFLTIANDQEVFAQIQPFMAQRPYLGQDSISIVLLPTQAHWILSTNGLRSSANINFEADTTQVYPAGPVRFAISWYALIPARRLMIPSACVMARMSST